MLRVGAVAPAAVMIVLITQQAYAGLSNYDDVKLWLWHDHEELCASYGSADDDQKEAIWKELLKLQLVRQDARFYVDIRAGMIGMVECELLAAKGFPESKVATSRMEKWTYRTRDGAESFWLEKLPRRVTDTTRVILR